MWHSWSVSHGRGLARLAPHGPARPPRGPGPPQAPPHGRTPAPGPERGRPAGLRPPGAPGRPRSRPSRAPRPQRAWPYPPPHPLSPLNRLSLPFSHCGGGGPRARRGIAENAASAARRRRFCGGGARPLPAGRRAGTAAAPASPACPGPPAAPRPPCPCPARSRRNRRPRPTRPGPPLQPNRVRPTVLPGRSRTAAAQQRPQADLWRPRKPGLTRMCALQHRLGPPHLLAGWRRQGKPCTSPIRWPALQFTPLRAPSPRGAPRIAIAIATGAPGDVFAAAPRTAARAGPRPWPAPGILRLCPGTGGWTDGQTDRPPHRAARPTAPLGAPPRAEVL
ncbi:proline-rich protein HaeIII subfamily 1-like [Hirundo rustica]|uniref:proline-rich protein HaeIII subfamily 1-like n=1 Tax=Hirundo rustica TaxID=43150 RepID=UPI001A945922|nr:proline-rich protein HaeIII subfamily 1-like [Hirundo rustica]